MTTGNGNEWRQAVRGMVAAVACAVATVGLAGGAPTPRMVPVDPLLGNVDADAGRLTFYYAGPLDGDAAGHGVEVALDGGAAHRLALGADRRVTVAFGAISEGRHDVEVALRGKDGAEVCRHRYGIRARKRRPAAAGRRLNNFVTEVLEAPLADGEVAFENPREGWVFVGFDRPYRAAKAYLDGGAEPVILFREDEPSETMRWLKEGRHTLRIEGAGCGGQGPALPVRKRPEGWRCGS